MNKRLVLLLIISFIQLCAIGQVKIVFRFDDYKFIDAEFNDSLLNAFAKYSIPINLGVIPFDENNKPFVADSFQLNRIKLGINSKIIDIQLHGYNHQNCGLNDSEFRGLSLTDQYKRLKQGKYFLDSLLDINLITFIPPWNTYDSLTLEVLDSLNFICISGNKWGLFSDSKIKFLPGTYEGYTEIPNIITNNKDKNAIIVVLLHKYEFESYQSDYEVQKISFDKLDSLFNWLNMNNSNCYTISEIIRADTKLDKFRYQANVGYVNSVSHYLSEKAQCPFLNVNVYYSKNYLNRIKILDFLIWTLLFLITFIGSFEINKRLKIDYKFQLLCLTGILLITFLALHRRYYSMEWIIISNMTVFATFSMIAVLVKNSIKNHTTH